MSIMFENATHKERFEELLTRMGSHDCYHQAIAYLFALNDDCYRHVEQLYDFHEHGIRPRSLTADTNAWQTGSSWKVCRLAYNLYNGYAYQQDESGEPKEYMREDGYAGWLADTLYTPYHVFDCCHAPFFLEAIKIRYADYFRSVSGLEEMEE